MAHQIGMDFDGVIGDIPMCVPFCNTYKDTFKPPQSRSAKKAPMVRSCFCDTDPNFINLFAHRLVSHIPSFYAAGMIQYEIGCIECNVARQLWYNASFPPSQCDTLKKLMALPLFHNSAYGEKESAACRPANV